MSMATKAYSYIRMSRPEQLRGDSLRRQLEASKAYAEAHGLDLDDSLRDLGLSAYSGAHRSRGALGAFLSLVERGEIPPGSVLIVESLDRLSRENVLDAQEQFLALIRAGVVIVTLTDGQTYSRQTITQDWSRLLISLTVMARAHEESATKAARLSAAWERKRSRAAERPLTARCPGWLRVVGGRFQVIEERAAIIRRIFEEAGAGLGRRVIAAGLNRDRVPTWGPAKRGRPHSGWQPSYITKLLEGEAVLGVYQPHRKIGGKRTPEGEPLKNYYPAIVPEDLYWRAKAATSARRKGAAGRKGKTYSNLFSGVAKCGCGGTMAYLDKGPAPKGGQYLSCDRARRGLDCEHRRHWRYETVESVVLTNLARADLSRVLGRDDTASKLAAEVEALRARLAQAEETERRMVEAFEGAPTKAVAERLRALEAERDGLRRELRAAQAKHKKAAVSHADLPSRIAAIQELRGQMTALQGDDLYRLRAKLAQELRRVLRYLEFTADGIAAFYAVPTAHPPYRFALPDSVGHPLVVPDPASMPGGAAEEYAARQRRRRVGRMTPTESLPPGPSVIRN